MAANTLNFNQIATILNSIVTQATGQAQLTPTNTSDFVTVANTGLLAGYDNLAGAISQVLSRTIFSVRPYTRKFRGLESDMITYGNHVRKINYVDSDWQDNGYLPISNGVAVDQQKPVVPDVVQTNFYGTNDYEIQYTIFRNQLQVAFRSADELGGFISGLVQRVSDQVEQKHEAMARMILCNLIAGVLSGGNAKNQTIHLITEYNAATGAALTKDNYTSADNYAPFMQWVYGRIAAISSMLTERSTVYHTNITDKPIARHTPYTDQLVYLFAPQRYYMEKRVLADIYHDNYLDQAVTESVNFWQSITTPDTINVTPTYLKEDGTLITPSAAVNQAGVFGVILDREAAGYTVADQRSTAAPYNAEGEYNNFFLKFRDRYWNDFTENAVVLLMD